MTYLFIIVLFVAPAVLACFMQNRIVKAVMSVIILFDAFVLAVFLAIFILPNFIGIHGVWLSFVICGAAVAALMMIVWKPFKPNIRRIIICSVIIAPILLTAAFAGLEIYRRSIPQAPGEEINLSLYMPFGGEMKDGYHDTLVKTLDEESSLKLNGNLPNLDGATALYPLYSAFVRSTYPEGFYSPYEGGDISADKDIPQEKGAYGKTIVACSRTSGAFQCLIDGYSDIVFLMGVSDEQRAAARSRGLQLELTPIGREAFVFFVNRPLPVGCEKNGN